MIKRAFVLLMMLLAMPGIATAYNCWSTLKTASPTTYLSSITGPSGDGFSIVGSRTYATAATYAGCATAAPAMDFVVTAPPGQKVTSVKIDGVAVTKSPAANTYTVARGTTTSHTIAVYYTTNSFTVTTIPAAGGTVSQSFTAAGGTSPTVSIVPASGWQLVGVQVNGSDLDATAFEAVRAANAYTITNIDRDYTVAPTFAPAPSASAKISTPGGNVALGAEVLVDGSLSSSNVAGTTYLWTVSPSTGATIVATADPKKATFTATAVGDHVVTLTVNAPGTSNPTATVTFSVQQNGIDSVSSCTNCHSGTDPVVVDRYLASPHYNSATAAQWPTCRGCHGNGHPFNLPAAGNACAACHLDGSGNVPHHPVEIGANACIACHNPHSTVAFNGGPTSHYNDVSTGMYPASYVTSRAACTDCHSSSAENETVRRQWATSGHAAITGLPWIAYDFKAESGCVQCHTTTGFIAYATTGATAAWGTAEDTTKEVLTCIGCHADVPTGALRAVAPVRPYVGSDYLNPDTGKSNLCMNCHSGVRSGATISARLQAAADFTNLPFVAPHYLAAGGALYGQAGYHFPGRSYGTGASHRSLGSFDASGPCVACHKNAAAGHAFRAEGAPLCTGCHGGLLDAVRLSADRNSVAAALEVLRAQLAAKGFAYSAESPHFASTNWGVGQEGANTMGAAFNYAFLIAEPGAFAHDPVYARQLLLDSIDYLDNGQFDDSVEWLAIPHLRDDLGLISAETAAAVLGYKEKDFCISCHGSTAASAAPITSGAHTIHLQSVYGPGGYLGTGIAACQSCHNYVAGTHIDGSRNLKTAAGSACVTCHAGSVPAWSSSRLECTSCHRLTPAVLPNGIAAPYKAQFAANGHGLFATSNQCVHCHDADASHISGSAGDEQRLLIAGNALCAWCHNDAAKVGEHALGMATHRGQVCTVCHDPHGTANPSMIVERISGIDIDLNAGYVQTAPPYLGLCQICHSTTAHYRAGVAEDNHPTTGCLGCHPHRGDDSFLPTAGSCNSCHGYPPASPALLAGRAAGTWPDAGEEKYAGGGGAHLVPQHVSPAALAAEGWLNCAMCHNGGNVDSAPAHQMSLPVTFDKISISIDPDYGFSEFPQDYWEVTEPPRQTRTGYCFSISCHMSPSLPWSKE